MKGLEFHTIHVPLIAGLNTKADPRALQLPSLLIAKNIEFEEPGGFQLRHPFSNLGPALTDIRRVYQYQNQAVLFTKGAIYVYDSANAAWVKKADYLAPKVTEGAVFVNTTEQIACDRAECLNVVFYAWTEKGSSTNQVYVAARDKDTGAVLLNPVAVNNGDGGRPKLLNLGSRVLLTFSSSVADLRALVLNPTNLSASASAASTIIFTQVNGYTDLGYDGVVVAGVAYLVSRGTHGGTSQYDLISVTDALVVNRVVKARATQGPVAISAAPNGTHLQIIREGNAFAIEGDYVSISGPFTDVFTGQAIGTASGAVQQIAAAHRSVQDGGQYRCYTFWSADETVDEVAFNCEYNWVDTNNTIGSEATLVKRLGVASRAFDYNGKVYVWLTFAGESGTAGMGEPLGLRAQLQNTYFLYQDDGTLIAKACAFKGGGFVQNEGHLPNVQWLGGNLYAWCGIERQVIELGGNHSGYGARAPHEIVLEFDSNEARRAVPLGKTLYISGGQILQFDGEGVVEVGFHIYPWYFAAVSAGGSIAAGTYSLKQTQAWQNAQGEKEWSTTATGESLTFGVASKITPSMIPNHTTLKQGARRNISQLYWRTLKDPNVESPFYLGTSKDPSNATNPNRYLANAPTSNFLSTFDDDLTDTNLAKKETNPENGGILETICPPPASILTATQDRLLLAGISENPYEVWYSRLRGIGEIASFHDALRFEVPAHAGKITGLAFQNETLIVFCERGIWEMAGTGFANDGSGFNYGPPRQVATDIGALRQEAIGVTPEGTMFHSQKGWFLLDHGLTPRYIGARVVDFDSDTFVSVVVMEKKHQVRCLSATGRVLMYNYEVDQWAEWTIADGVHAFLWKGEYYYTTATQLKKESTGYTNTDFAMDVEFAWFKPSDLQGYALIDHLMILGENKSDHALRVRLARDYQSTYFDDKAWAVSPNSPGEPEQVRHFPTIRQVQALKVRITTQAAVGNSNPPGGEAFKFTGLAFKIGFIPGLYKGLPAAQSQ